MSAQEPLLDKIQNYNATVAVLGLGYVGLPFAIVFGEADTTSSALI